MTRQSHSMKTHEASIGLHHRLDALPHIIHLRDRQTTLFWCWGNGLGIRLGPRFLLQFKTTVTILPGNWRCPVLEINIVRTDCWTGGIPADVIGRNAISDIWLQWSRPSSFVLALILGVHGIGTESDAKTGRCHWHKAMKEPLAWCHLNESSQTIIDQSTHDWLRKWWVLSMHPSDSTVHEHYRHDIRILLIVRDRKIQIDLIQQTPEFFTQQMGANQQHSPKPKLL